MGNQWRRLGFQVGGPLLALVAAGGIELLSRGVFQIPNPPAILIMLVVLSGIMGGFGSGMVTAAIAWLFFAYFFSVPGLPLHYTADNFRRVVVWAVTMPATVVMVGLLKRRAEHTLEITKENAVLAGQVQAERRYRGLFNSVPIGLFRTSPDGTILDANPALVDMLGFPSREALLAVNIADVHVDPQQRNGDLGPGQRPHRAR